MSTVRELARLFFRLGATAFGGPAAHVAMMHEEIVRRRQWMTNQQFLDYISATSFIPGPNSTELALHVGHARAGWRGLLVAGLAFITPAVVLVTAAAAAYVRLSARPDVTHILSGLAPVVVAVIAHALWTLGRSALKSSVLAVVAASALIALVMGVHELTVLALAGAAVAALRGMQAGGPAGMIALAWPALPAGGGLAAGFGIWPLFLVFLKIGSVLFGSGYVLVAFLRADLVERLGWITERQLLDAVAIGQGTPGPLFATASFIGYLLGGLTGAAAATAGIFLPAFVLVGISGPLVPRLRKSALAASVLDGVNAATVSLIAFVLWEIGRTTLAGPTPAVVAAASLIALVRYRVNPGWLMLAGGALGWLTG
jgi:chromate transporter